MGISHIFNVVDLYIYTEDGSRGTEDKKEIQWKKKMPVVENPQMEQIVDR